MTDDLMLLVNEVTEAKVDLDESEREYDAARKALNIASDRRAKADARLRRARQALVGFAEA